MTEFLLTFLNELTIAALAALPVIEFRGAVIYGLYLGMTKPAIGVSALIGCALSSYALIILLEPCYKWLKKKKIRPKPYNPFKKQNKPSPQQAGK